MSLFAAKCLHPAHTRDALEKSQPAMGEGTSSHHPSLDIVLGINLH